MLTAERVEGECESHIGPSHAGAPVHQAALKLIGFEPDLDRSGGLEGEPAVGPAVHKIIHAVEPERETPSAFHERGAVNLPVVLMPAPVVEDVAGALVKRPIGHQAAVR